MPMTWNSEADAKLFLGVLNQLKDGNLKLDYKKLATFMGEECLPGAVQNRIVRLKRKAEEGDAAGNGAGPDGGEKNNKNADGQGSDSATSETPKKRKRGKKSKTPAKKVKC